LTHDIAALEWVFWISAAGVVYGYIGYALLLKVLVARVRHPIVRAGLDAPDAPSVTILIPVHNERATITEKVRNVRDLRYPIGKLKTLFVCDGCTDGTAEFLRDQQDDRITVLEIAQRGGKAGALNEGLRHVRSEIVVFTDASIMLTPDAVAQIVRPFADGTVGCVSGEDQIAQAGGEGLYGRYELTLRRLESQLHSIVGASGSFYAQRRELCAPFAPGLAPDFLSVLHTVERGYRAVAEPGATGMMAELSDPHAEFSRKVRTILRGMTTLAHYAHLLNPFRYGWFAFELFSHKLMRWLVPFLLALLLLSSALLARASSFYMLMFAAQMVFYALAALAFWGSQTVGRWLPAKISLYFTSANVATASAWLKFLVGTRQEVWSPSRR
jgi:cellulose synthase/poly-beta-1,6-N-acetylglucosamine synthase-like glycosyltransferase